MGAPAAMPSTMMVPRCTFRVEKCQGGFRIRCSCEDKVAVTLVQNLCSMLQSGMCSCCCMLNGMVVCCCYLTMGTCRYDVIEDGICVTCTSGDSKCCQMLQACCDCLSACMDAGCTCCLSLNSTPICCGVIAPRRETTGDEASPEHQGAQEVASPSRPPQPEKSQSSHKLPVEGYPGNESSSIRPSTGPSMAKQAADTSLSQALKPLRDWTAVKVAARISERLLMVFGLRPWERPLEQRKEQVMILGAVESFHGQVARCLVEIHGVRLPVDIPREALDLHGLHEHMRFEWLMRDDGGIQPKDIRPLPPPRLSPEERAELKSVYEEVRRDPASDVWNHLDEDD
jgi:hypothetical protein